MTIYFEIKYRGARYVKRGGQIFKYVKRGPSGRYSHKKD